jgi:hypothetical protein
MDYARVVAIVDALNSVRREIDLGGMVGPAPALAVSLSPAKEAYRGTGDPLTAHRSMREEGAQANGRLAPEVIQRVVRQNFGHFRACYERGLTKNASLSGRIAVRFVIQEDGTVRDPPEHTGSTLADRDVSSCLLREFGKLSFPKPDGGIVTVVYPLVLSSDDPPPSAR